jgi:RNA polymerase sigma-70 factor (ECF subfamily)
MYAQVRDAVGRLPDRYRTVILLRYFEGLPCDMVAEVLHRRIGTVKSWLHRGAKRLRGILEQEGTP